jgi:hypothetical protein
VLPQDTEASLRAQLAAQVANAQSDIESHLAALRDAVARGGNGAVLSQATDQLTSLSRLQKRIGGCDIASLTAIRSEVAASVAATQALVQTAAAQGSSPQSAQAELYAASANAERSVRDFEKDFYERRIFDPYLKFASKEDEEAYRQREAERQQAIEKAREEHTPQGELRAVNLSIDQLNDAGAHGADRSPDYQRERDRLTKVHDQLSHAISSNDQSKPQTASNAPASASVDPLQDVGAKAPDAKGIAAKLLAAGISPPQSDNVGNGVSSYALQNSSNLVRGG